MNKNYYDEVLDTLKELYEKNIFAEAAGASLAVNITRG